MFPRGLCYQSGELFTVEFIKRTLKINIEFREVLNVIYSFLNPIFSSIVGQGEFFGTWNPEAIKYEEGAGNGL